MARNSVFKYRGLTLARYAILVETAQRPELAELLADNGARVSAYFTDWFRVAGSTAPERHAPIIMNHVTGLVLHQLAIPDPEFAAVDQIGALIDALLEQP